MSSDVYGLDVTGTGGWDETIEDQLMAADRQIGTTTEAGEDRLFALLSYVFGPRRAGTTMLVDPRIYVDGLARFAKALGGLGLDPVGPSYLPRSIETKLNQLAAEASEPGWDGERGLPVEPSAWEAARNILRRMPKEITEGEALHVSMSGDGFVHLTVSLPARGSATVEVGHGKFYWTWMRGMDPGSTAELASLTEAVAKLCAFAAS